MKKYAALLLIGGSLALGAAEALPRLPGTPLKPVWKTVSTASVENGVYRLAFIPQKAGVNYASFKADFSGSIKDLALNFSVTAKSDETPEALYVRIYNKNKQCIGSWRSWSVSITSKPALFSLVPGQKSCGLDWEPDYVKSTDTDVARVDFLFGRRGCVGKLLQVEVTGLRFAKPEKQEPAKEITLSTEGFELLGIPAQSAELRSSIGYMENGRHYLLTRPQDHGATGYLLLTDLDSGKTEQYFNPPEVRQRDNFGSILTSKGLFIYDHGGRVVAFDTKTRKTRYLGHPDPKTSHFMVCTEAPDGTVYMGGTYTASVTAYDPATGKFRNYGRMDPKEKYINKIVTDKNGYVYCGIGSARANLVALDPKTGKVTQIIPEKMRSLGWGEAVAGADGYAYMRFGKFSAKLLDGKIVETGVTMPSRAKQKQEKAAKYGGKFWKFPDGAHVRSLSLDERIIVYVDQNGKRKNIPFEYKSGGLHFTSMANGGHGKIFGSTSHPMHFVEYDTKVQKFTDHGPHPLVGGGNFCNITAGKDGKVYMCQYPSGKLWQFDPLKPFASTKKVFNLLPGSMEPYDLAAKGKAEDGHFSMVSGGEILLCFARKEGARFTIPIPVSKAGQYYLNLLAYEHDVYGKVRIEFAGKSKTVNLQNLVERDVLLNLGPVDLKPGDQPLVLTVYSSGRKSSRSMAGFKGILLTADKPAKLARPQQADINPVTLGAWLPDVTRPRAVQAHPDGQHVVISGFPGYGYCGGGFGIHNLKTGKNTRIKNWLEGHSCFTFRFTENGDIVGGTDISAPGGGHVIAKNAAIFRLNWKTQKVTAHTEIPGLMQVADVELWNGKLYAAQINGTLTVADPVTMKIERSFGAGGLGPCTRNALQKTPDNRLFLLQKGGISEIHPKTGEKVPRARMTARLSAAGANEAGYIYYASGPRVYRWKIPAPLK